jgi:rhodanese-related sulfurtransferase
MDEVDVRGLRDAIDAEGTLIDVREYAEFAAGRVRGAKIIPLGAIVARAGEIDLDRPVYLMCRTGRRSAEAQRILRSLGFENVVNVTGGISAWQEAGFPVERDEKAPWSIERQVRFVAGLLVTLGVALSVLVALPLLVIAALVGLGLMFSAITDTCAMGNLLARLPWNAGASGEACDAERATSRE